MNYYNENDPYAVQWLENLIAESLIPEGHVDARSVHDVIATDLIGFTQCHFFAGIAGWPLALQIAGWPEDRPVWTGSCPCQPFSVAGKKLGEADSRHLWPVWFRLIRECRPSVVFGEQVAAAIGQGWYDAVADDLEGEGYAVATAILPACAVGAPHRRDRLWFIADSNVAESGEERQQRSRQFVRARSNSETFEHWMDVADAERDTRNERRTSDAGESARRRDAGRGVVGTHAVADAAQQQQHRVGTPRSKRWDEYSDGGWWSVEPAVGRVAHGVPARVGRLRAYGNAIVPQVAAEFIAAAMECLP